MFVHLRNVKTRSEIRRVGVGMRRFGSRFARRGAVTVLATFLIIVAVLLTILLVDSSYLIAVNRGMQDVSSIMALAGAPELLDPNLLLDAAGPPVANQAVSRAAAAAAADQYRVWNNGVIPALQRLDPDDVTVQTGFVDDVTARPPVLDLSAAEHNTVFVYAARSTSGTHAVSYPVNLAGTRRTMEIRGGAYATLDNLVVGFRPEIARAAPLMPLGILTSAWNVERVSDGNGDGINEMVIRLESASPPVASQYPREPNGALLFYGGTFSPEVLAETLPLEMARGVFPGDLPPSGTFGPVAPVVPAAVLGTQMADGADPGTVAMATALAGIIGQRRAFPLLQSVAAGGGAGTVIAQVEGFVAATVLAAEVADNRLVVRVQPCYLIHHTVWTVPPASPETPAGLQRNLYLYKLRLSR
jgi:hypothetical protein